MTQASWKRSAGIGACYRAFWPCNKLVVFPAFNKVWRTPSGGDMSTDRLSDTSAIFQRVHGELIDSFDEELEMEIDDDRLANLLDDVADHPSETQISRQKYFKE